MLWAPEEAHQAREEGEEAAGGMETWRMTR
jgi:hypothetical protein